MAYDRFIYWTDKKPTKDQLKLVLTNYLDGAATEIEWDKDRFFVTLIGKRSFPFVGLGSSREENELALCAEIKERWIEVCPSKGGLDVITRMADAFTNDVASGLAESIARYWGGRLE